MNSLCRLNIVIMMGLAGVLSHCPLAQSEDAVSLRQITIIDDIVYGKGGNVDLKLDLDRPPR